MESIIKGNLTEEKEKHPERRGWFIGHFVEDESVFKTDDFEIRWTFHPKGDKKPQIAANMKAKTVSVLIKGKFVLIYPDQKKEVILSKPGDFVYHDAKVYHGSEALEDSIMLTIRWPSILGDQKPMKE